MVEKLNQTEGKLVQRDNAAKVMQDMQKCNFDN